MGVTVNVTRVVWADPSIVVMEGIAEDGDNIRFAVDYNMARSIAMALDAGEDPMAWVEGYQVLRRGEEAAC